LLDEVGPDDAVVVVELVDEPEVVEPVDVELADVEVDVAPRAEVYDEQMARPTDAAEASNVPGQADSRHGATDAAMAAWLGPHWQAMSVCWQPTAEMTDVKHGIAQAGSAPRPWAAARPAMERTTAVFIFRSGLAGLRRYE